MDYSNFFETINKSLFQNSLSSLQKEGIQFLLDVWYLDYKENPIEWLAYCLATVHHETAFTFQPIEEYLTTSGKLAERQAEYAPYYGRGYVQLTWESNYKVAGNKLNIDLVNQPELALRPVYAAKILFSGMIEGWFTGKKLKDYINNNGTNYIYARRIVNGLDKASPIAEYATKFEEALVKIIPPVTQYGICLVDVNKIKNYQAKHNLVADGVIGSATWFKLTQE